MTHMSALRQPHPEPVCSETLAKRICVRPPYFALQNLEFDGQTLTATGPAQLPRGGEYGPMTAGDIGRHAAIAGLCAAALTQRDDQRRYYLAQRADYTGFAAQAANGSVRFESKVQRLDKRAAAAHICVYVGSERLAELVVNYSVLTASAFERLFRDRGRPVLPRAASGNYHGELQGRLESTPETLRLYAETVPEEVCAGHFDGYPAMPVATLMGQLSRLAGTLVGKPYRIAAGQVAADDLLWAGSAAIFEARRTFQAGKEHRFTCSAHAAGRVKGQVELTLVETS